MKRKEVYVGKVTEDVDFPATAWVSVESVDPEDSGKLVWVKNVIPGQHIEFRLKKKEAGNLIKVIEASPFETGVRCDAFGECGGCVYQPMIYEEQLLMKERQIKKLFKVSEKKLPWEGIEASPLKERYRNKMEYTFGDSYKGGPLTLGLHKRSSRYDIVGTTECMIVHDDFNKIVSAVVLWAAENDIDFYHSKTQTGVLRHLVLRRSEADSKILAVLVTTTQEADKIASRIGSFKKMMTELGSELEGSFAGILHTQNDNPADTVTNENTDVLYGQDFITEDILGMHFKISAFSFFQTNSLGAERLYEVARDYALGKGMGPDKKPVIFDLYSGTGTIAQMLAPVAEKVIGIEIVEEAVDAARQNAVLNGLDNCEFIAGDVLKAIDNVKERPDLIILDPPRDGVNPKALEKILDYKVENIVYISCKPTSLERDLSLFEAAGYKMERMSCVDMFPGTAHVETVVLMSRVS